MRGGLRAAPSGDGLGIMTMSDDERRRWAELEAELSRQHRLAALTRRLGDMPWPLIILWWAIGGILGLALVVSGAVVHSSGVVAAGAISLTATVVPTGIALIATGLNDYRRQRHWPDHHGYGKNHGSRSR